ncbi:PREDICTED: uncharacterized protein LOC106126850 [Papilio xuthus]|uniref:Uncharacterized protein LOC106126850 n=1 Tax=Papilio xuthus TaxID=66420 RepID=A0AAJ6ZVV6_PAPXU|nr:PREDICTED: uncharacterized protein LOC106126850 [Papilio xuthus]XP_013180187.1 PREDICTED: uncharacterized protein LOC106126850 [Papilio xuthus]
MNSKGKIEKWLFEEWSSGRVVNSRSMLKVEHEVSKIGVPIGDTNTVRKRKHLSNGRHGLEADKIIELKMEEGGPSGQQEDMDFSSSASSWEPSDDNLSSEDSEPENKTNKTMNTTKQYTNKRVNKKGPIPLHRPNAIIPNVLQPRQTNIVDKKKRCRYIDSANKREIVKKSLPDSTRKNTPPNESIKNGHNNVKDILDIKSGFRQLFQMIKDLKTQAGFVSRECNGTNKNTSVVNNDIMDISEGEESDRSQSVESNRSDDNVLISNKYARADVRNPTTENITEEEWIPIGSGKTLIHKDKYKKVNWKSYTIATRTLLLATFPRRILATHSLTGKRSPAFRNKPAKMCLDPKIVSDVIMEITSRFRVKENLVRSIITTKCADECKMFKLRMKHKNKQEQNQENTPPIQETEPIDY